MLPARILNLDIDIRIPLSCIGYLTDLLISRETIICVAILVSTWQLFVKNERTLELKKSLDISIAYHIKAYTYTCTGLLQSCIQVNI